AVGKANLRIGKFGGTSNDGSGLPGSYPGTREVIDPADIDVFWNSNKNRWEISFDVTGFSGFVVQTKPTVLPLTFLEFKGQLQNNNGLLSWKTSQEINVHSFDIERSLDGRTFHAIGNMPALNQPGNNFYHYTDYNITTLGVPVIYYRLLQKDNSGQSRRSGIMALSVDKSRNIVLLYPNPVTMDAVLTISIHKKQPVKGRILDNTGRIIKTLQWNLPGGSSVIPVELKDLTKGVYYIELTGDTFSETKRFVKQ
ncbi:MAG TPA: T9SS type A sorting domain-containing protein, partial [Ferruginibacter sp.]|nr:T9SS type A sorting domain-containing protein [Ferruginibacter sp.]